MKSLRQIGLTEVAIHVNEGQGQHGPDLPVFRGDFVPYFPLQLMHKDLELAMEAAYAQN